MARAVRKRKRVARSLLHEFGVDDAQPIDRCIEVLVNNARARSKSRLKMVWGWDLDRDAPLKGDSKWKWQIQQPGEHAPAFYASNETPKASAAVNEKKTEHATASASTSASTSTTTSTTSNDTTSV